MICLDIRGKVCPFATNEVYAALRELPATEPLDVFSDYAPARTTIPALVRQFGRACNIDDSIGQTFIIHIDQRTVTDSQ